MGVYNRGCVGVYIIEAGGISRSGRVLPQQGLGSSLPSLPASSQGTCHGSLHTPMTHGSS